MKNFFYIIVLFASAIMIIISCSKASTPVNPSNGNPTIVDCTGPAKSYANDVDPIIQTFCNQGGCHASGSVNGPGPLTNYNQVFNARSAIRPAIASGLMPQVGTLTAAQKNNFLCWLDSGAPNN